MDEEYDFVVIGAGSGGMAAAKKAASRNFSVALIEEKTVGGTCVARGCMPKKFLFIAAKKIRSALSSGPAGFETEPRNLDWADLIDHEQNVVDGLIDSNRDGVEQYDNINLIEGTATLEGEHRLTVNEQIIQFDKLVIASGMRPAPPPIDGKKYGITSDEFLQDHNLPNIIAIVGGGYIGVEFASILNAFGVEVKIFQRPSHLIDNHDVDIAEELEAQLKEKGIQIYTDSEVQSIEKVGQAYRVSVAHNSRSASYTTDRVLLATGRKPNTEELNLEEAGIQTDNGFVDVDDSFRTSLDHVFAVGDVNGRMPFTPVAIAEGKTAAINAIHDEHETVQYDYIPTAVFTHPEIGSVGLSEQQAKKRFSEIETATGQFKPFEKAVKGEKGEVFMKLIYRAEDDRLVGLHVLGPESPEIVQGFSIAMKKGLFKEDLRDYPGIHPTLAEELFTVKP